jgi:hypothetical protein
VRDVGQQRAERDDLLAAEVGGHGEQLGAERAPSHVRLDAAQQHDVAVVETRHGQPGGGPLDAADGVFVDAHERAVDLEVVVLVGVEGSDGLAVPHPLEMLDPGGGRLAGVVPPLECRDQDRIAQLRRPIDLHHARLPDWKGHNPVVPLTNPTAPRADWLAEARPKIRDDLSAWRTSACR